MLKFIHQKPSMLWYDFSYSERDPLSSVKVNPFRWRYVFFFLLLSFIFVAITSSHKRKLQTMFWINYNFLELIWKMCSLSHISHSWLVPSLCDSIQIMNCIVASFQSYQDLNHTNFSFFRSNIIIFAFHSFRFVIIFCMCVVY